jgi:hypothetical protein
LRIEPGAGAVLDFALGRFDAVRGLEHVGDLRQEGNPRVDRNVFTPQAGRHAATVPVLVEAADGLDDGFGKTHLARDLRAAVAACFHQFLRDLTAVLEDIDQGAKPPGQPGLRAGVRDHEAKHLRQAAIDGVEVALEAEIVGQIKLANERRVAAEAEILEERCVYSSQICAASRPISEPMWMPIQQQRTQWPAGWPSTMSSA